MFPKLQIATASFVMYLPICMEQLIFHCVDFYEVRYFHIFQKLRKFTSH